MATLPTHDLVATESHISREQAVDGLYNVVESFFDDIGLSEAERDARYQKLRESLDASDSASDAAISNT
jgi:hypothetical protein